MDQFSTPSSHGLLHAGKGHDWDEAGEALALGHISGGTKESVIEMNNI